MKSHSTLLLQAWRTDRFTWVVLVTLDEPHFECLFRCDIEGTVRPLEPTDRESGKLFLYPVPAKSVPSRCRCAIFAQLPGFVGSRNIQLSFQ